MRVKADARFTHAGLRLVTWLVLALCATVVLTIPTPVGPTEFPSLVVSTRVDAALLESTRRRARSAPDDALARALDTMLENAGRREAHILGTPLTIDDERHAAVAARRAFVARHGKRALAALRARAVIALVDRFDPTTETPRRDLPRIGGFRTALAAWGAVRGTRRIAPPLVIRVLYAARWNVVMRLAPTSGFGEEELRAYYGWLALHADAAAPDLRFEAATRLAALGRERVAEEALAVLLYREGEPASSARSFDRIAERTHSTRARNHALAARLRAQ